MEICTNYAAKTKINILALLPSIWGQKLSMQTTSKQKSDLTSRFVHGLWKQVLFSSRSFAVAANVDLGNIIAS